MSDLLSDKSKKPSKKDKDPVDEKTEDLKAKAEEVIEEVIIDEPEKQAVAQLVCSVVDGEALVSIATGTNKIDAKEAAQVLINELKKI